MTTLLSNQTTKVPDSINFKIRVYINQYYPPFIIVLGTLGNVLSVIIYGRRSLRKKPISLFMRVLAVVDSVILLIVLFTYWLHTNFTLPTTSERSNKAICVAFTYIVYVFANWSHYILAALTIYRLIAVASPFRATILTVRSAKWCIICIGIVSIIKNFHWLWSTDFTYDEVTKTMGCDMGLLRKNELILFLRWFEVFISFLAPFFVIFIANIFLVRALRKKTALKMRVLAKCQYKRGSDKNMTILVLAVSFLFLILVCPLLTYQMYYYTSSSSTTMETFSVHFLSYNICQKLYYTNNAINFYVYALVGREFRRELKKYFKQPISQHKTGSNSDP